MRYRKNRRTHDLISEIGLGSAYISEAGEKKGIKALQTAYEGGINYYDLAAAEWESFKIFGEAFKDIRKNIMYQIHFGADYTRGSYGWSLNLETIKRSIDKQLSELHTDYIDYGFIHCQDELSDWEAYQDNGVFSYICDMKNKGVVKHIGLSSHTPSVIQEILNIGVIDMLMFSVNPAYDYQHGQYAYGGVDERAEIYKRCEKEGIGISVMKPFSGGQLLSAKASPFRTALSIYQCIKYALDKPGILTVLPGAGNVQDVKALLDYYNKTSDELDYSVIGSFAPAEAEGKCVYCNHCKPCPEGIDIGLINKYYDLACMDDPLAIEHYKTLDKKASDCISCGHCDKRCPFGVKQSTRMKIISQYFGE